MSATIIRFPQRHRFAIVIHRDADDGWYVLRGSHGWIHGDRKSALEEFAELIRIERTGSAS